MKFGFSSSHAEPSVDLPEDSARSSVADNGLEPPSEVSQTRNSHLISADRTGDWSNDEIDLPKRGHSRVISAVLAPAVRLWLRSQLDQVEELQFQIEASDRQLLSGAISRVVISATKAIYQGLHLSQVSVTGKQIQTNLRQVIRRQPLRLLEPFPIWGTIVISEADLNASLQAPLLAGAIADFLSTLLNADPSAESTPTVLIPTAARLDQPQIALNSGHLTLSAALVTADGSTSLIIRTGLRLQNGNQLQLDQPQRLTHLTDPEGIPLTHLDGFTLDLGSEVSLEELSLEQGQILCRGRITVMP